MAVTVVFKLGGLGDLLMATPALRAYRRSFPDERIVFIVGQSNRAVLEGNPHVDELIGVDDRALFRGGPLRQAREALRVVLLIRAARAQTLVILHRDWRWNLLGWLSRVPQRLGFARDWQGLFLTSSTRTSREEHETVKYQHVFGLRPGYHPDGVAMDAPQVTARSPGAPALTTLPGGAGWIALSPGGAANVKEEMDTRRWPIESFIELAQLILNETPHGLVLIGAASDAPRTRELRDRLRQKPGRVVDVAGSLSVAQAVDVLRTCRLLVTHDSGPMHLGAAAEIPVIGLFGPTYPVEKVPLTHPLSRALWRGDRLTCSPCYHDGILPPCSNPVYKQCMLLITPGEVFTDVQRILQERGRA